VFLGNGKKGTGGVRVINKGHIIVNNFFFQCKGVDFRSPLSIMNGVPNSPANRYVGVSDAIIANNSFYDCTPISFCEGRSEERSLQPKNVQFINNLFYTKSDTTIYHIYDDMSGIYLANNKVSSEINKHFINGFANATILSEKKGDVYIPKTIANVGSTISDSLQQLIKNKLNKQLSLVAGYEEKGNYNTVLENAYTNCGAKWYALKKNSEVEVNVNCNTVQEITSTLEKYKNGKLTINLTGNNYEFTESIPIDASVTFTNGAKKIINFKSSINLDFIFELKGKYSLGLKNLNLNLTSLNANKFITSDTSGTSNHSNLTIQNCSVTNYNGTFFHASKSSLLDSIIVKNNNWSMGSGPLFYLYDEADKKGYYNVEKLKFSNNSILNHKGSVLSVMRSGKDESTLGPLVEIDNNKFKNLEDSKAPLILFYGVQKSFIRNNVFNNCNPHQKIIEYKDEVRAAHMLTKNILEQSGTIAENEYVKYK
jgi:poly(beta-D-mannuronate) lyase